MISQIKGTLLEKKPGQIVVEAASLGYEIAVPLSTFLALPEPPSEVKIFTRLIIREDAWDLYGFLTKLEKETFLALTSVNRIGPKLALTIISSIEPGDLAKTIMTKDLGALSRIKGIGGKTAERLLLELKDKAPQLAALAGLKASDLASAPQDTAIEPIEDNEALSALMNLGYTRNEAEKSLKAAQKELGDLSDLGLVLRSSLKFLSKSGDSKTK